MITVTVTIAELKRQGAICEAVAIFRETYGNRVKLTWDKETQIGVVTGPLRRYLQWAIVRGIIPAIYLRGANLRYASLGGADLSGADLGGADLSGADLGGADLSGADLGSANLSGADLHGVNLRYATLRCANLHGVNLRGADLDYADLCGADLDGVVTNEDTVLPEGVILEAT